MEEWCAGSLPVVNVTAKADPNPFSNPFNWIDPSEPADAPSIMGLSFPYLRSALTGAPKPSVGHNYFGTRYCGPGGSGVPLNATDTACAQHDACYGAFNLSALFNTIPNSMATPAQVQGARGCNQQLCNSLDVISASRRGLTYIIDNIIRGYFTGSLSRISSRLTARPGTECH